MKCEDIKKKLIDYLDGSPGENQYDEIKKHLEHCQNCRKELEEIKRIMEDVKEIKIPEHDKAFWDSSFKIMIDRAHERHNKQMFIKKLKVGFGLLAVLLVFFTTKTYIKNKPIEFINVPEITYLNPDEVLSEQKLPFPVEELLKVVDYLEPEDHMMILAEYLR
jgi:hypothetical protein